MAEVIKSGNSDFLWKIDLKCPRCGCVARFGSSDRIDGGEVEEDHVRCPECQTALKEFGWRCRRCNDTGYCKQENDDGYALARKQKCPCRSTEGKQDNG